ncbi:MAG: dihydropyrimidinase [Myxococcales bacterium]|jgi:dihydropyrimidinase|nr:dihydropyrimidinase [Myxococcales bacterium]
MATLIVNGTLVTASESLKADLRIEGEKIDRIGTNLPCAPGDTIVDARGLLVMPGGIDAHTHLDLPISGTLRASDDFETGTRAAAFGGTTSVIDFVSPARGQGLMAALDTWHGLARGKAAIDYGFHMSVVDERPEIFAELDAVLDAGVPSFKIYTAYPDTLMISDGAILRLLTWSARRGTLVLAHAENGSAIAELTASLAREKKLAPRYHAESRPSILEGEATARLIALAEVVDAPLYIVHVTCIEALEAIRAALRRGLDVYSETCPHYLFLAEEALRRPGFEGAKFVCSPPLRPQAHAQKLWQGLALGDIDAVSTDHCPFDFDGAKTLGREDFRKIPNGLPSIETRLTLMWQGVLQRRISENRFVELVSTAPARIHGLCPRKGVLTPGADADIVLWDPNKEVRLDASALHMRVDYSPYEGMTLRGAPSQVFSRGECIVDGEAFLGKPGRGQFLRRAPTQ